MGILNLPCARTVQGYLRNNRSSPGISEQTLLQNHEQYEQYKLERKKSGYAVPKGVGILIWDETKVSINFITTMSSMLHVYIIGPVRIDLE